MAIQQHHFSITASQALPSLDGVFAVAFTLMAYSIPEELSDGADGLRALLLAVASFLLGGAVVILFWFKLRRLMQIARELHLQQLIFGFLALLSIVALPKIGALAIRYGQGTGSISDWTTSQAVNTLYLGMLYFFDGLVLLFANSLRHHGPLRGPSQRLLGHLIQSQSVGFAVLIALGVLQLLTTWFNSEYLLLVPLVLLFEELFVAHRFTIG